MNLTPEQIETAKKIKRTHEKAHQLSKALNRRTPHGISVHCVYSDNDARVEFRGGRYGPAGVWMSQSDADRVESHFAGYCAASGHVLRPRDFRKGKLVGIPSKSSPTGARDGRIVEVTGRRVKVAFEYNSGKKVERWFPKFEVW